MTLIPLSAPQEPPLSDPVRTSSGEDLTEMFLAGRSPRTTEAYGADLAGFQRFVGASTLDHAAQILLSHGHGQANALALSYRNKLKDRGLQPATINRRLASLRSLVKLARTMGMVSWSLEVSNERSESYRDTRGPGRLAIRDMLAEVNRETDPKAIRDRAILRLLYDLGLRVNSVVSLDMEDVDLAAGTIQVVLKGRSGMRKKDLPEPTKAALQAWTEARGQESGPLFTSFDRARKGSGRLSRQAIHALVKRLGNRVGHKVWPHGIRHTAVTEAYKKAQENGIDLEEVTDFSDHRDVRTLMIYRDRERNVGGKVAELVAAGV